MHVQPVPCNRSNEMSTKMNADAGQQAPTWDHSNCEGTKGCPPRCPRFVDKKETPLRLCPYNETAFEALVDFYDEYPSRHRSMSLPPLTRPQVESWLEGLIDNGRGILAFDGDRLVGHVAYTAPEEGEPELIVFIDDDYQNRGLGTELCRQALAYAGNDGYSAMELYVNADNKSALAVYRSLGFREVDQQDKLIEMCRDFDDEPVDDLQDPPAERL